MVDPEPAPYDQLVADSEAHRRFDICRTCPQLLRPDAICQACGCFMKVKVRLADAECPLQLW